MDYEQAIDILKVRKSFVADINIDAKQAYKLAIESLEKQIPMLLADEWEIDIHVNGECNNCGEILRSFDRYCSNCGQRAKWN